MAKQTFILSKSNLCKSQFEKCIHDCMDYIIGSSNSVMESDNYMKEIDDIIHFTYLNGQDNGFIRLVNTGIFHDAIGEIIEISNDKIIVETEY